MLDTEKLKRVLKKKMALRKDGILCQSDFSPENAGKAFKELLDVTVHTPLSSYIELKKYRQYVPVLLVEIAEHTNEMLNMIEYYKRIDTDCKESGKYHKRWTKNEDEWLIEAVCHDEKLFKIAAALGRTPSAVQTRITYLVGVKRLSQQVAGKFIGTANGEEFKAALVGTIYKD